MLKVTIPVPLCANLCDGQPLMGKGSGLHTQLCILVEVGQIVAWYSEVVDLTIFDQCGIASR